MSLLRVMTAVGCVTGMVEGVLRSSHHSLGSAQIAPQVLQGMMKDAEDQWISGYRGALNGTANASEAMTDVQRSCVRTAFAMVDSVKGHKNGLQKRMKSVCNTEGQFDELCGFFSTGLLASVSDDTAMNVAGKLDGELGSFCGHFLEASVRPRAEAHNKAAQDHHNKVQDRKARIEATMRVVAKAQEEVKKAQKAQKEELKVAAKPLSKKHSKAVPKPPAPSDVEALKKAQLKAKQETAEREGGAKGLEAELAREEESEDGVKGQVVKDALALETTKDEPLPKHPSHPE